LTTGRSRRTAGVIDALEKKIDAVAQEEKYLKARAEHHETQREQMIAEIQSKSKKGGTTARGEKENIDDTMELDDMPNSSTGNVLGNLLGLGGKRTK
jgi:hypothetical protein